METVKEQNGFQNNFNHLIERPEIDIFDLIMRYREMYAVQHPGICDRTPTFTSIHDYILTTDELKWLWSKFRPGKEMPRKYFNVTLCGSTKFKYDFEAIERAFSLAGAIVISVGLFGHADKEYESVITTDVKSMLDDVHKQKIDMADLVVVVHSDYIGESTQNEINYARSQDKPIVKINGDWSYQLSDVRPPVGNLPSGLSELCKKMHDYLTSKPSKGG